MGNGCRAFDAQLFGLGGNVGQGRKNLPCRGVNQKMNEYSMYDRATGRLTGARIAASRSELIEQTLPDGVGVVLGAWDHLTHVVNLETGEVLSCDAPPDDWRQRQGVLASAQYQIILRAEAAQARPMRELLDALLKGIPAPPAAVAAFDAIKAEIAAARLVYSAMLTAKSGADLDALCIAVPNQ